MGGFHMSYHYYEGGFMEITKEVFGESKEQGTVNSYTLKNSRGACVEILEYGARIRSIQVPDKNGDLRDVVFGIENLEEYEKDDSSIGAVCGRFANRIAKGLFTLNGKEYHLATNNGPNSLHGGPTGFGQRVFSGKIDGDSLVLTYISADGEEGFPGELKLTVTYRWSEDNELSIVYEATTDQDTILNVTNHAYFNLNGCDSGEVLSQKLIIDADRIAPNDDFQIPTGEWMDVEGTPFDFRKAKPIGQDINAPHPQLQAVKNTYDHCFALNGEGLREAAVLYSEESGIRMTCFTDQPALQLYVNDFLLHCRGKGGKDNVSHGACCLETQHYPDSINHPNFPTTVLKPGETFHSETIYNFSIID